MKKILTSKYLVISIIILLGIFLRFHNLSSQTAFNADQEWLAFRARDILNGDFPLLGPVTSIGNFSIGPGFIYLWAIFGFLLNSNPISGAYLSVFLGILFIVSSFVFVKLFIDEKTALLTLFLMSISSMLIIWDQNPWAPSLFYLSQTILIFGTYLTTRSKWGYPLIVAGLIMGFQSHFGIFLSFLCVLLYLVIVKPKKPDLKVLIISLLILIIGFSPNILFDLTHNFTNLNRLLLVFKGDDFDYFIGFGKIINILSYNAISVVYPRRVNLVDSLIIKTLFALVLANGIRLLRDKKYNKLSLLLLITAIFPPAFFFIQQGKFSEYYLIMTVPSLIFLLALFLKEFMNKKLIIGIVILVSVYLNYGEIKKNKIPWNLKAKMDAVGEIVKLGRDNYGISLTTKFGEQYGFRYIFDYYGINADVPPKKGETRIFTIVVPEGFDGVTGMKDFDGVGLIWQGI